MTTAPLWDRAVHEALEEPPAPLASVVQDELADLWHDLGWAIRSAINGQWSMQCGNVVRRIVTLSQATVALPWDRVPSTILLDGWYDAIMTAAGISFEPPDMNEVRALARRATG